MTRWHKERGRQQTENSPEKQHILSNTFDKFNKCEHI